LWVGAGGAGTNLLKIYGGASSTSVMDIEMAGGGTGNPTTILRHSSSTKDFSVLTGNSGSELTRLTVTEIGDISFYEDTGTTPKFFWDASAEALGLATTTPQAKLDVSDVSNFSVGYNTFSGDGLHIQCNGTGGDGAYAGGISFSRISSDNDTRA
jgi:hypothetical protein